MIMQKSQTLKQIMYLFVTATIVLIYAAIVFMETSLSIKLAAGGVFSLIDAVAFALLMVNQQEIEKEEVKQQETEITYAQTSVKALPEIVNSQPKFYCPKCKTYKNLSEVYPLGKGCRICDTKTIQIFSDNLIECQRCHALNNFKLHSYCRKCMTHLDKPEVSEEPRATTSTEKGETK